VSSTVPIDSGIYTLTLSVSLQNYPLVPVINKTIRVTIICEVFTLTFSQVPSNIFAETGVTGPTA